MTSETPNTDERTPSEKSDDTAKWAVIMAKVGIRRAVAGNPWPRWHILKFTGPGGREARGVVDLIAIRKDHGKPLAGTKHGDTFQIILIQAKGGSAAMPTALDAKRLRVVADHHGACHTLLAAWKKGKAAEFYSLRPHTEAGSGWRSDWSEMDDDKLRTVFGRSKGAIE